MPVLEIQARWTLGTTPMQSVHYWVGDTLDGGDLPIAAATVEDAYFDNLRQFLHISFNLEDFLGRVVSVQGSPYVPCGNTQWSGILNQELLPLGHTVLTQFTRNAPSPNRKRVYTTGFTVFNLSSGVPGNGLVAAANAFGDQLLGISQLGLKPAQYAVGRYTGSPAYMPTAFALEQCSTSTTFGHMESREG